MASQKTVIAVRLTPRASRDHVGLTADGVVEIRVTAPPVDGAANDALLLELAKRLDVPKRELRIVSGETSRHKRVACPLTAEQVVERLGG